MANIHGTLGSLFTDIANAIRTKTKKTDSIVADNFPEEIKSIVLGSGDAQPSDVKEGKTFTNDSGVEQTGTFAAQEKSTSSNGTVEPDSGKYLSKVTVSVPTISSYSDKGNCSSISLTGHCLVIAYAATIREFDDGSGYYPDIYFGTSGGSCKIYQTGLTCAHSYYDTAVGRVRLGCAVYECWSGNTVSIWTGSTGSWTSGMAVINL